MNIMNHTFNFVLRSPSHISESLETALVEAGCDDVMLFQQGGALCLEFDREAVSLLDAILSALVELHGIEGVEVQRVGPEDLVTPAEIARRTSSTREAVRLWALGKRGPGDFPHPVSSVDSHTRVWRWTEVVAWLHEYNPHKWPSNSDAHAIAATNAALTLRSAPEEAQKALGIII